MKRRSIVFLWLSFFLFAGGFLIESHAQSSALKINCNCAAKCAHAKNCFGFKAKCNHGKKS
ncbi:hypothetical protein A7K93_02050 [Candidatus Methylacidiphilum fumarolicum]|nr:hypothetical protein A7K73_01290 [Candidatus Methylacidiphilum fumarolicum]TFE75287.1 hypothetical protein A7K93_02050 [Candidatus Methylacidiphilum fumarolicum]TFE76101.1 hypothetical protein A7K72_00125 [Candidatus Methylacidiphilum fumarolicum]TFE77243.1 hypothetical protein A7D33_05400 [Candidatus Methylacidiphilum fumarolicum]